MTVENDPSINLEPFICAAELERAHGDVATGGGAKDREPFDDRRRDKMRVVLFVDPIAAAHCFETDEAELQRQVRSQAGAWERGVARGGLLTAFSFAGFSREVKHDKNCRQPRSQNGVNQTAQKRGQAGE